MVSSPTLINMIKLYKYQLGQSLVELMIAVGLFAVLSPALITGLITSRSGKAQQQQRSQATILLKQTEEQLRHIKETGWVNLKLDTYNFGTTLSINTSLNLISSPQTSPDGFIQYLTFSPIITAGQTDPSLISANITVKWDQPINNSQVTTNLTLGRYDDNALIVSSTGITLSPGGGNGDWCQPTDTNWGFNLLHSANCKAIYAIEGGDRAYVGSSKANNSDSYDVKISEVGNSMTATSLGLIVTGQKKVNGVFGDQNYAYSATDTKQKQGVITDANTHQEIGWLDLQSNNVKGQSIVVSGNYAYLSATDKKIYIFNIGNSPAGVKAPIASISLNSIPVKIFIIGSNIYAAMDSSSNQLAIISLINSGSNFGTITYVPVNGQNGRDVFINNNQTRAYLVTGASTSQKEIFVIDIDPSSQTYIQTLASQDTNGMDPKGVAAVTNNKVITVGTNGIEYQVYNYNDTNKQFSTCPEGNGFYNNNAGIYGLSTVSRSSGVYTYIITGDSSQEFRIIKGGPGGSGGKYALETIYIPDQPITTPSNVVFNRFVADTIKPAGTDIQFQVAATNAVSGVCPTDNSSYTFVGPDGSSSNFTDNNGVIPWGTIGVNYVNPGRCFKYKAIMTTTNSEVTPVLNSFTIKYSP